MKELSQPFRLLHERIKSFCQLETFLPACLHHGNHSTLLLNRSLFRINFPGCHALLCFVTLSHLKVCILSDFTRTRTIRMKHPSLQLAGFIKCAFFENRNGELTVAVLKMPVSSSDELSLDSKTLSFLLQFFFFFYKQNCNINTNVKKNCTRIKLTKHLAITEKERKRKYVYTRHNKTNVIQATIKEMPDCICTDAETQLYEF